MLGYLSANGTLTFKKSYFDDSYYNLDYLANRQPKNGYRDLKRVITGSLYYNLPITIKALFVSKKYLKKGNPNLKSKKGKGSRTYRMTKTIKKKIECGTLVMRYNQNRNTHVIKFLTLTFAQKHKNSNKAVSRFFNRLTNDKIIISYWWVKEYHPQHFIDYGIKKEHYHCLVLLKKYTRTFDILELWQLQSGIDTIIIKLKSIIVDNKYNSFNYQIVMYVAKYCVKGIDSFNSPVFGISESLRTSSLPLIYPQMIDYLLKSISQNENLSVNEITYYRKHWNQAYLKKHKIDTYLKIRKWIKKDKLYKWLYEKKLERL